MELGQRQAATREPHGETVEPLVGSAGEMKDASPRQQKEERGVCVCIHDLRPPAQQASMQSSEGNGDDGVG